MESQIIVGDCLDVLRTLPAECVDMALFSPPYDQQRTCYDSSVNLHDVGIELLRVAKDGGVCAVVMQDQTRNYCKSLSTFRLAVDYVDCIGWKMFETCIYNRHGTPGPWWKSRFRVDHEYILLFHKGLRPRVFDKESLKIPCVTSGKGIHTTSRRNNGRLTVAKKGRFTADIKCRGTVWQIHSSTTESNRLKLRHPATFPDRLAGDLVTCFTVAGDLVLDPFVGSGTTAVMAHKLGRRYLGIDLSEDYAQIARERLACEC